MNKRWYWSKTLWTAAGTFAAVLGSGLSEDPAVSESVKDWVALLLPLVMAALRTTTTGSITK